MKLTPLQRKALLTLYRRAMVRSKRYNADKNNRYRHYTPDVISLSAGKQSDVTEPADLLRWDRIGSLCAKGLVRVNWDKWKNPNSPYVQLTPLGCRVAREMEGRHD